MIVKTYGVFDTIAEECIKIITSKNDDTAKRAVEYIVREKDFDKIAGRDYVLEHLYDFDTESRLIVDNSVHVVANFGQALAAFEAEQQLAKAQELIASLPKKEEQPSLEAQE